MLVPLPITRDFIRSHPAYTFVYSTNYYESSINGQASVASGEPNTIGVPVRFRFCQSNAGSYFDDYQFDSIIRPKLVAVFAAISERLPHVVIFPKIGDGASRLKERAPVTYAFIKDNLTYFHECTGVEYQY